MTADLAALYRQVILDHNRHPHGVGELPPPCGRAEVFNPLCGDRVLVTVMHNDDLLAMRHETDGCAVCTASASVLAEQVNRADQPLRIADLADQFGQFVIGDADPPLPAFSAFAALVDYPSRRRCSLLPWEGLRLALADLYGSA